MIFYKKHDNRYEEMSDQLTFYFINRQELADITAPGTVHLDIHIAGISTIIPAFVTTNLCTDLMLGMGYLLKYDIEIKAKKILIFHANDHTIMIPMDTTISSADIPVTLSNSLKTTPDKQLNTITTPSSFITTQQVISNLLHHKNDQFQRDRIQSLLFKFQFVFDTSKYTVAQTKMCHAIETYPHTPPVSKSYPGNPTSNSEM
ncbi:unnamed protein product [Rotaria sp. Silwood2]|nr:unnamed protein product [Rotaria sp. Silwood2]CAF3936296.1 unnamed protein product [Rotaria sp. Silwood2]CAF4329451.1 unnamed protein product [Rotaria sp. Silwood2]CAF4380608.1 unnamed protein product [Rotaria sp. Silwood2]